MTSHDITDLKWVNSNQYGADIGVNVPIEEPSSQVLQQRLLIKVWQLAKVWILPVLWLVQEPVEIIPY